MDISLWRAACCYRHFCEGFKTYWWSSLSELHNHFDFNSDCFVFVWFHCYNRMIWIGILFLHRRKLTRGYVLGLSFRYRKFQLVWYTAIGIRRDYAFCIIAFLLIYLEYMILFVSRFNRFRKRSEIRTKFSSLQTRDSHDLIPHLLLKQTIRGLHDLRSIVLYNIKFN